MSIGSKMRSLGESTYFLKAAYEPLKEIMGDKDYVFVKDPINGYVIHTNRIDGELLENVDDLLNGEFGNNFRKTHYNHNMEISWQDINKYARCTTAAEMQSVNPDYKNDITSDGEWVYPLPKMVNAKQLFIRTPIVRWDMDLPQATTIQNLIAWDNKLVFFRGNFPKATHTPYLFESQDKLQEAYATFPVSTGLDNAFPNSKLNKKSVVMIIDSLQSFTSGSHRLTIGIHVDYQNNDEVLAAITNAEAKGWTLTVRWNGTPTAQTISTFGLRKPSIYAKLSEIERPNGSKEQNIDWGHYVTNSEDYQEFSSLEDVYEHFGLPNDLEKLNNSEQ